MFRVPSLRIVDLAVSINTSDRLERPVFEMSYDVLNGTLSFLAFCIRLYMPCNYENIDVGADTPTLLQQV